MKKEEYIDIIESLNTEIKQLYNTPYYKKYRDRILIRKLIKSGRYKLALQTKLKSLKLKAHRILRIKENYEVTYKEIDKKKTGKRVVYTCILNNYDTLYSPLIDTENTSYIVFSDNMNITNDTNLWEYRKIPEIIKKKCNNNYTLINRYIKMHPHELFPDFDLALYIDGSVRIMSDISSLFYKINDKTGLAMHLHPKRNNIYEEAEACLKASMGNAKNIKKLINKYKQEKFPYNSGLFEATVIAIDLKNQNTQKIMDSWWRHFIDNGTGRDQLSLTYILWKLNYNAYEDMGVLGINLASNPKFRRNVHHYDKIKRGRDKC